MRKLPIYCLIAATIAAGPALPTLHAQARAIFVVSTLQPDPSLNLPASSTPLPTELTRLEHTSPSPSQDARHRPQIAVSPELRSCRQRYADAVYKIGLARWTAPDPQRRALERLLNAATAVQAAAANPNPDSDNAALGPALCNDATLTNLEATVIRLKAKGWVPLEPAQEQVVHNASVGDELKRALAAIWR